MATIAPNRNPAERPSGATTELIVQGMTCAGCARSVTQALNGVAGVADAQVDLQQGKARVRWKSDVPPNEAAALDAVRAAGFEASAPSVRTELAVGGMTCSGCARTVTQALDRVPGVENAQVTLETGRAVIRWKTGATPNPEAAMIAVREAGYEAVIAEAGTCHDDKPGWSPFEGWKFNVVVGSLVTIPLMIGEWAFGWGMERWFHWLSFALVLPLQTVGGARFYRGAWNQLKIGSSNMDTLVALGSTTAFAYSVWGLFAGWHAHLYFMDAAAIITLISSGHWIEAKASARAANALKALLNLAPQTARRLSADGAETDVPVAQLHPGDRIVLRPGDRVPTDGEVADGSSAVDESMLTGESMPVEKEREAKVFAGTVNESGRLVVSVTATGEATALAHIITIVQRAQNSRANIQKLGDRVSSVFVPIVVLVAIATALWWGLAPASALAVSETFRPFLWTPNHPAGALAGAIYHMCAVLIIACPCAMGLATPVAIMAGTNVAARRGILIRDGQALEKSGVVKTVVFDKTGTLTRGEVTVAASEDLRSPSSDAPDLNAIAAAVAAPSNHPLSRAVAGLASEKAGVSNWEEKRGSGVQGRMRLGSASGETLVRLGSIPWLRESGVELGPGTRFIEQWSREGATLLGLADDRTLIGVLALRDAVKPHAAEVVAHLKSIGTKVCLITGDNRLTAEAIARQVGIPAENVFAEVRPEKKAEIVQQLQGRGERVAFVGDGINDAPALEQADLGIAVSRASDVAREAADIILLKSDIQAIPEALGLARATLRTIKQNLFWAFFYNAAGIPLAMLGFMSPVLSAFAMGMSDLVVIGNALRLNLRARK